MSRHLPYGFHSPFGVGLQPPQWVFLFWTQLGAVSPIFLVLERFLNNHIGVTNGVLENLLVRSLKAQWFGLADWIDDTS